jgi:hypothetical protein
MSKPIITIIMEAIIIGLLFVALFYIVKNTFTKSQIFVQLFLTASLFHIICEYSGLNIWYVKDYNKYLKIK